MNSKARFLPLVLFAAVLVSLVFIIPVFSATGTVRFVETFARQGGTITAEVTDSDLNVPIKRVLLPIGMTQHASTANVTAGSAVITMSAVSSLSATATTTASVIAPGDTILIGDDTVRKVVSVNAGTGVVTVNKAFTAASSTAAVLKVTQTLAFADTCPDCAAAERVVIANTGATFFGLSAAPIADSGGAGSPINLANRFTFNGDTVTNTNDLFLSDANGLSVAATTTVTFVTGSTGLINVNNTQANFPVFVLYWGASVNDTGNTVKVTSQADAVGILVVLTETGPTTSVFRLTIDAVSTASNATTNPPRLKVGVNDSITLSYADASPAQTVTASITVETTGPVFSNLTPAHNSATQSSRPVVEADVTDSVSGVKDSLIRVIFAIDSDFDGDIDATLAPQDVDVKGTGISLAAITGGFRAVQRLPASMAPTTDATVYWWVKSTDDAGNVGISDRQVTIASVSDACDANEFSANFTGGNVGSLVGKKPGTTGDVNGCQPFAVKVDFTKPVLSSAKTGPWWDTSKTTTDKTETDVTKAKNTSILVTFSEDLDGTTVQASDFQVDGVAPLNAESFSGAKSSVFLTVPAMAGDATPSVDLVGQVKDLAGNIQTTGSVALATDGIAPGITVTLTGTGAGTTRNVTNDKMTILIVTDEDTSQPVVNVRKVGDETSASPFATATTTPAALLKAARTFEAEVTFTSAGLYNVYVTALDVTGANRGIKGTKNGPISIESGTSALLFEVDTSVPTPIIGLADPNDPTGFLVIDFQAEGTEYASTGTGGADFDSHDTVTIVAATLDGSDITPLTTSDSVLFMHSPSNLTTGGHAVVVTARDVAGNQKQFSDSFTVSNLAPVVDAGPDKTVPEGSTLALDQTTFTDVNEPDTHTAVIDWGDGATSTAAVTESGGSGTVTASHVYPDDDRGPFTVTVTVTDNLSVSHSDTLQANVTNVNPTLEAGADQSVATGTVMSLAPATFGDLGVLDTHSAVIVWGDGTHNVGTVDQGASTISQTHLYSANGTYAVTIIAIDDDGGFAVDSFKATVGSGGSPPPVPIAAVPALVALALAFAALLVWKLRRKTVPV